ncbi:asparaginase [Polychytrium aggregatum]|uniref:asparaginase n=1 Tax=Polychytrium aggregatum TaxID=110093 RepID=UPI0022FEF749|nr:asparaginase [Polychytrium aggregatum]KAI9203702.1 asparaginase [Polychytrium aggregatum]
MTPEDREGYLRDLRLSLEAGYKILQAGGSSLDATEAAVRVMEDSPLFNAGKGAVFSRDGKNVLEASIMDGRTRKAGAATQLMTVKNPISLARKIMDSSPHVFVAGADAESFASSEGLEIVDPGYFWTERRWKQHKSSPNSITVSESTQHDEFHEKGDNLPKGTVGACALDRHGNLAAATSTGGKTNKWSGRIGDSPIIGAGTFAENRVVAVSATGDGEYFIRWNVAYDIASKIKYGGQSLGKASKETIDHLKTVGGEGGIIAIDSTGKIALEANTPGMFRGYVGRDGVVKVAIFMDEPCV